MTEAMTIPKIISAKGQRKLSMLTAYDYPTAYYVDQSKIDMILVGDSLAMVVLGMQDTLGVGMWEMLHHTRAVSRAVSYSVLIGDMPFMSYQASLEQAVRNAGKFLQKGRAQGVKLEGGQSVVPQIRAMVQSGIPVQGHLGLTPQSAAQFGGFKVQGRDSAAGQKLLEDAQALEEAGCFSIVLEAIPSEVAARITEKLSIPTIGIGAGVHCDGQVLVLHDMAGLFERFTPKFVKKYASLGQDLQKALQQFRLEVQEQTFPGPEHSFFLQQKTKKPGS